MENFSLLFSFVGIIASVVAQKSFTCDHAAVGAGPAGVYFAWRLATDADTPPNTSICLFESLHRVGGRVASITGTGPHADLVVEPGAYRFAPIKFCIRLDNGTACLWTPVVAGIIQELGLKSKPYNPDPKAMDHNLFKIVDDAGADAGFAQYVWGMLRQAERVAAANRIQMHVFLGHSLQSLALQSLSTHASTSSGFGAGKQPLILNFTTPTSTRLEVAIRQSVLLNLPQQPLLQVMGQSSWIASDSNVYASDVPPAKLHNPSPAPYLKLYVHYSNAWWRGGQYGNPKKLNLTSGTFSNLNETSRPVMPGHDPMHGIPGITFPAPLKGSYHDGDVRCRYVSGDSQQCRGYIQAQYSDDIFALMFYRSFGVIDFGEPFNNITRASHGPAGVWLLDEVHASLVALHAEALGNAAQEILLGKDTQPDHAVLAIWDPAARGFGAACHFSRLKDPSQSLHDAALQDARKALMPYQRVGEHRIFVASEAFAPLQCWSEGALQMAENALQRLGRKKPTWMSDAIYKDIIFPDVDNASMPPEYGFAKKHGVLPQFALHPVNMPVLSKNNIDGIVYS